MGQILVSENHRRSQADPNRSTLKIYWYLLLQPRGTARIRQIQRAMGYASPNAAIFHLDKLVEMQLLRKTPNGEYHVHQRRRYGVMKAFYIVSRWIIPKHAIYAVMMTFVMVVCTVYLLPVFSLYVLIALIPGFAATGILWFEALLVRQQRPRFRPV